MRNILLTAVFTCLFILGFAQYSNPYRMTHDGTNYLITNKGNGTVSKLDSTYTHTTIISGLQSPNDIFYGSIAGNNVIIIIDSNTIKLYDSTSHANLLSIPITGVTEAHDGIFNPSNSNEFFISDRAGNKIVKGSIGSAPFYNVTFSTFVASITKPAGMIINNQGKLLVVSDTANAKVYEVNTSTGAVSAVLSSSFDNFNDLAQDNEGNYYVTCWGNSNLYRYSSAWTNPYSVATFNHPSGLYANINDDILGITCTNCQKVEFKFFHLFSPLNDVITCAEDSFFVSFTPSYNGIGTYKTGNKFLVQMSDSNGNFDSPVEIGSVNSATRPSDIKASVPYGKYAATGHKYRLASTSPSVLSYFTKDLTIKSTPDAALTEGDTLYGCINTEVALTHDYQPSYEYSFFPPVPIIFKDSITFGFTSSASGMFNFTYQERDTNSGCVAINMLTINISNELKLSGLADSLSMCKGDTMDIGIEGPAYKYIWQPNSDLSPLTSSNPMYSGDSSLLFHVEFSDSNSTCFGTDSVFVQVNPLPSFAFTLQELVYCKGDTVGFQDYIINDTTTNTADLFEYEIAGVEKDSFGIYTNLLVARYPYTITYTNQSTGCYDVFGNQLNILHRGDSLVIAYDGAAQSFKATEHNTLGTGIVLWKINGTTVADNQDTLSVNRLQDGDTLTAELTSSYECKLTSNRIIWKTLSIEQNSISFGIIPNPSQGMFQIAGLNNITEVKIFDMNGKLVFYSNSADNNRIETENLKGLYLIEIRTKDGTGRERLIIE
ncbi:T9SS type A sorting domain-containing protein [Bacteroidia bacterium]|nr:T9SS type A sorting domain-containing protein [Bacteroidia bacterium]MDB9881746.1 T9SS type A sorting domain-containing protein [Bacteroidia bacterium]